MSIIMLLVYLALIGLFYWAITTLVPMPAAIARIILVVCVVVAILLVLSAFGLLPSGGGGQVPQIG
jgi:hypothetical protein